MQQRVLGIKLRVDVAPLPLLQHRPFGEWTWRAIGQSDDQAEARRIA